MKSDAFTVSQGVCSEITSNYCRCKNLKLKVKQKVK